MILLIPCEVKKVSRLLASFDGSLCQDLWAWCRFWPFYVESSCHWKIKWKNHNWSLPKLQCDDAQGFSRSQHFSLLSFVFVFHEQKAWRDPWRESKQTASTTNRKVSVSTTHDILPRIAFQRKRPERDGFSHGRISVSVMRHACWKRNIVDHSPPVNFPMSSWVLIWRKQFSHTSLCLIYTVKDGNRRNRDGKYRFCNILL